MIAPKNYKCLCRRIKDIVCIYYDCDGSIIAREYGIPAVVNVGNATKIIRTGQIITVDGDNGIVRITKE